MEGVAEKKCRAMHHGFFLNAKMEPNAIALDFGNVRFTYIELADISRRISKSLEFIDSGNQQQSQWTAVWCSKSVWGYAGILGVLHSGRGYLPIAENTPIERAIDYLVRANVATLLVDEVTFNPLCSVLERLKYSLNVVMLGSDAKSYCEILGGVYPNHRFQVICDECGELDSPEVPTDKAAYLMFTSGSTGRPKGVVVTHGNVRFFLDDVLSYYQFRSSDRFSQFFDFTFDLSVFDIFVTLEAGGCLCPMSSQDRIFPARFINRSNLTVWFSVPSFIHAMKRGKQLKNGAYPNLRYSLFCGEALSKQAAWDWQRAAPNSITENLYGPTEATIACTRYRLSSGVSDSVADSHGAEVVPIGKIHNGMTWLLVDLNGNDVENGTIGELLIAGPQVAAGYWDDPEEQRSRFVKVSGNESRYYRTGDNAYFDERLDSLCFVGRSDQQVKIRGFRIELGEVEVALRKVCLSRRVVALAVTRQADWVHLVAVIEDESKASDAETTKIKQALRPLLPDYMLPDEIVFVREMPQNSNGKIDRKALRIKLEEAGGYVL